MEITSLPLDIYHELKEYPLYRQNYPRFSKLRLPLDLVIILSLESLYYLYKNLLCHLNENRSSQKVKESSE